MRPMNRIYSLVCSLLALSFVADLATANLVPKPNVAPVVSNAIPAQALYLNGTRTISLGDKFRDPDASAAVRLNTPLGVMNFTLDGATAPITVANFLHYLDTGRYFITDPTNQQQASLFFHRSVANFVIQTGGFLGTVNPDGSGAVRATQVPTYPPIQNEPVISNKRGTIAMAKLGGDPNSATSQWFINLADNSANLDNQNGGFTVFGRVAGNGMTVADSIAALPTVNVGSPFDALPLRDYTSPNPIRVPNLVSIPQLARTSPLLFSASSNHTNIAGANVSGTNLALTGAQVGVAQVTSTATDLDGVAVSQHFNVVVRPLDAAADFNRDAKPDYVLENTSTHRTAIWYLNGVTLGGSAYGPAIPSGWKFVDTADFDRDGDPDYLLVNINTRQTAIWYMSGSVLRATAYGPALQSGYELIGTGDFNGDGRPDYVLQNSASRRTAFWFMNNNGRIGAAYGPTLPANWIFVDSADFNRDGNADYLLVNGSTHQTAIWYMSHTAFSSSAYGPTIASGYDLSGATDFNADGKPDYVLQNTSTRRTAIWYLNNSVVVGSSFGPTLAAGYTLIAP
jgi:cyclophilin family peptidyl-prolyl cis-trans isomerase